MKVYLAGGMRSDWRARVKQELPELTYLDPCEHGYKALELYSVWDARAIDHCDVLFGYLEASNPSGYGLAAEIGRACVLGKLIIFVDEKNEAYWDLVRCWCSVVTISLPLGIEHLRRFARVYP